jgi:hypothetical protein
MDATLNRKDFCPDGKQHEWVSVTAYLRSFSVDPGLPENDPEYDLWSCGLCGALWRGRPKKDWKFYNPLFESEPIQAEAAKKTLEAFTFYRDRKGDTK